VTTFDSHDSARSESAKGNEDSDRSDMLPRVTHAFSQKADHCLLEYMERALHPPRNMRHRLNFWIIMILVVLVNLINLAWCLYRMLTHESATIEMWGTSTIEDFPPAMAIICPLYDFRFMRPTCDFDVRWNTSISVVRAELGSAERVHYGDGGLSPATLRGVEDLRQLEDSLDDNLVLMRELHLQGHEWDGEHSVNVVPKGWALHPCDGCNWTKAELGSVLDIQNKTEVEVFFKPHTDYAFDIEPVTLGGSRVQCLRQPLPPLRHTKEAWEGVNFTISWSTPQNDCSFSSVWLGFIDGRAQYRKVKGTMVPENVRPRQIWAGSEVFISLRAAHFLWADGEDLYKFYITEQQLMSGVWPRQSNMLRLLLRNYNMDWDVDLHKQHYTYTSSSAMIQFIALFNFSVGLITFIFPLKVYGEKWDLRTKHCVSMHLPESRHQRVGMCEDV